MNSADAVRVGFVVLGLDQWQSSTGHAAGQSNSWSSDSAALALQVQGALVELGNSGAVLREALDALDPNALTPLEALVALAELKAKVEEG